VTTDPASLANLRGLALPPPVSWWPPQPGWWVLLAGLLCLGALGLLRCVKRYQANAYRRAALRELRNIERRPAAGRAVPLAMLIKRVALVAYPRAEIAGSTGAAWAGFLAMPGNAAEVLRRASLDRARPLSEDEAKAVLAATGRWIRRHDCSR
jgi:Domain of unknown function (DUF4381)